MLHQKNMKITIQHRLAEIVQGLSAANSLPAIMVAVLTLTGCAPSSSANFFREVPAFTVSWDSAGVKASCKRERVPSDFEQILKQAALAIKIPAQMGMAQAGMVQMAITQGQAKNGQKEEIVYGYSSESIGLAVC